MAQIAFIGTGKMSASLISCIYKKKGYSIIVSSRTKEKSADLKKKFPNIIIAQSNTEAIKNSDVVFICVKPQDIDKVLEEIKDNSGNKIIVSIAAGIKTKYIESRLKNARVIRVMPNVACLAAEMAGGISKGKNATKKDLEIIIKILRNTGKIFAVNEDLMDIVTAISGSGPAFFAYFIKAFEEAGVKNGLSRKIVLKLASQTALGTAKLILEKNMTPEELINMVTSPKGTTVAGLEVLDRSNAKEILEKAVEAAARRSRELAK